MLRIVGVAVVVVVGMLTVLIVARASSEFTQCFTHFEAAGGAERAALAAEQAGFDADAEEGGADAREPTSPGGRRISVVFSDGETGSDADGFRSAVRAIVIREGGRLPPGGCIERTHFD